MRVEREVKLEASGGFQLPGLDGVAEGITAQPRPEQTLDAVYYDTADLRLSRSGVSLRHRAGDDPPWTVKLPEDGRGPIMSRREITFAGPAGDIPPPAASLVRAYSRTARLTPVAHLKTRRSGVDLLLDGRRVAEVVDDEVSVYQGRRLASRFREVEVEVEAEAPDGLLDTVVARLRAAGAGEPERISKVVRALGPGALAPPDLVPVTPGPGTTMAEVVRAALTSGARRIVAHDPGVRLGDDPEDVHQARVGTRRLRSDLRTFRPLLDPEWVASLRAEAGWFAGLLGTVRDAEVLMERFEHQARRLPPEDAAGVMKLFVGRLADERDAARARLLAEMDGRRYLEFLDRLVEAAAEPVLTEGADEPAAEVLPVLVRRPWRRLRRAVQALPAVPAAEELHAVRILAKHARYAAEAAAGVMGKPVSAFASALAGLQTVLGEHQDACVTEGWLRANRPEVASAREAMLIGELIALQREEAASRRAAWTAAWRRTAALELRAWLR